jgi:hypothetical protein|tara:strand:- start:293 stop:595 length:303 start_codon:yes stop_codon:yes gene_type:complete
MAIYNTTVLDNANNIMEMMVGVGTAVGDPYLIGYLSLLSFFLIFLILSYKFPFNEVVIFGSFLTSILSLLFYASELVPGFAIAYPSILFFISLLFYLFRK